MVSWGLKGGAYAPTVDGSGSVPADVHEERGASPQEEFRGQPDAWWHPAVSLEEILEALLGWLQVVLELIKQIWDVLTLD